MGGGDDTDAYIRGRTTIFARTLKSSFSSNFTNQDWRGKTLCSMRLTAQDVELMRETYLHLMENSKGKETRKHFSMLSASIKEEAAEELEKFYKEFPLEPENDPTNTEDPNASRDYIVSVGDELFKIDCTDAFAVGRMESICDVVLPSKTDEDKASSRLQCFVFCLPRCTVVIDTWSLCGTATESRAFTNLPCESSLPNRRRVLVFGPREPFVLKMGYTKVGFAPKMCCLCLDKPRTVQLPCGHHVMCSECLAGLKRRARGGQVKCPVCRLMCYGHQVQDAVPAARTFVQQVDRPCINETLPCRPSIAPGQPLVSASIRGPPIVAGALMPSLFRRFKRGRPQGPASSASGDAAVASRNGDDDDNLDEKKKRNAKIEDGFGLPKVEEDEADDGKSPDGSDRVHRPLDAEPSMPLLRLPIEQDQEETESPTFRQMTYRQIGGTSPRAGPETSAGTSDTENQSTWMMAQLPFFQNDGFNASGPWGGDVGLDVTISAS